MTEKEVIQELKRHGAQVSYGSLYLSFLDVPPDPKDLGLRIWINEMIWKSGWENVSLIKKLPSLREIGFSNVPDECLKILRELPKLDAIYLHGDEIVTDVALEHLKGQKELRGFSIASCRKVTDKGLLNISQATKMRWMNLGGTDITNRSTAVFRLMKDLETLHVDGTWITPSGMALITKDLTKLTKGRVSPAVGEAKRPTVAECFDASWLELRVFEADGYKVTDKDCEYLAKCTHLEHLDLNFSSVGDKGLEKLAQLKVLKSLRLAGTSVSNQGIKFLLPLDSVAQLDLSATNIDDGAVEDLLALKGLRTVAAIMTPGLTSKGRDRLQEKKISISP